MLITAKSPLKFKLRHYLFFVAPEQN